MHATSASYKQQWIDMAAKDRPDLIVILDQMDPFDGWEESDVPVITIGNDLCNALDILYAGTEPDLAEKFLIRALAQIERTKKDNKFAQIVGEVDYPLTCAEFLSYKYYVHALLGRRIDKSVLYEGCNSYLVWLSERQAATWHDLDQALFLAAVAAVLIAGDATRAFGLFESNNGIPWFPPEGLLWQDLCQAAALRRSPNTSLAQRLWERFDVVRDPGFNVGCQEGYFIRTSELRLEFGAIMWKYVEHPNADEIDWQDVIELISR